MTQLTVRDATYADALVLSQKLRQADIEEINAGVSSSPLEALENGLKFSEETKVILDQDGSVIAMFGWLLFPIQPNTAMPWLTASDDLEQHSHEFIRRSKEWVDNLNSEYETLQTFSYEKNMLHHSWLECCGFKNVGDVNIGSDNNRFLHFKKGGKDHV